jgi:hypothetical protein
MPFPELMDRLFRLFNIKNSDEPALSIPQDRPLTSDEKTLIEWLLIHAEPNASEFLPQLEAARVCWKCGCGCPTINIEIPQPVSSAHAQTNLLSDLVGEVDGKLVGVMLTQAGGRLSGLEIYAFGDAPEPFGLPDPSTLYRFEDQAKRLNQQP